MFWYVYIINQTIFTFLKTFSTETQQQQNLRKILEKFRQEY